MNSPQTPETPWTLATDRLTAEAWTALRVRSAARTADARVTLAKRWAQAHGYTGARGGWISTRADKPAVQGYLGLYRRHWLDIERELGDGR